MQGNSQHICVKMEHTLHIGVAGQNLVDLASAADSILMDSNSITTDKRVLGVLSSVASSDPSPLLQKTGLIAPGQSEANTPSLMLAGNLRKLAASKLNSRSAEEDTIEGIIKL